METPSKPEIDNSQGTELSKAVLRTIANNGNSINGTNGRTALYLNFGDISLHHSSTEGVNIEIVRLNGNSDYLYIIKIDLYGGVTIKKYDQVDQAAEGWLLDPDSDDYNDVIQFIDKLLEDEKIKD